MLGRAQQSSYRRLGCGLSSVRIEFIFGGQKEGFFGGETTKHESPGREQDRGSNDEVAEISRTKCDYDDGWS